MVNRVYIIDDDDISLFLSSFVVEESGFAAKVHTFSSADTALRQLSDSNHSDLPEVILLDLSMPGKNGWDFLETLRQCEQKLQGRTCVYILTSSIAASDKARSKNYRLVQGFLHKPLNDESLNFIRKTYRASNR